MTADTFATMGKQSGNFDPVTFPLSGKRLIEASAGTGKTYNIANLFLRLILGHGSESSFTVDEILVVTFTRAATSELNGRIRARLEEALTVFRGAETSDNFLRELVVEMADQSAASIKCLNDAILSMDEASISTIHSFAVQAAKTFLFETGALADIQISESGHEFRVQVVSDLYRDLSIRFSESYPDFFALVPGKNFRDFHRYFDKELPPECLIRPSDSAEKNFCGLCEEFNDQNDKLLLAHSEFLQEWQRMFPRDPTADDKAYCNGITVSFNDQLSDKFKATYKLNGGTGSLAGYLDGQLSGDTHDYLIKNTKFFTTWMSLPAEAGKGDYFDLILRLRDHFKTCFGFKDEIKAKGANLILQKLHEKQGDFALDQMSLDDVIRLINNKLADEQAAPSLRQIITQTYPVCLVDEFQDTDPEQFTMFNEIYSNSENGIANDTGFFMIGDPKQSIYAFRGADIFSYLNVRKNVQASQQENDLNIFSLDTNWRSKAALVEATNRLFSEPTSTPMPAADTDLPASGSPVFIFDGIEYQPVKSCENSQPAKDEDELNKGRFSVGPDKGLSEKPLVIIGNEFEIGKAPKKGILLRTYAADTAARISAVLDCKSGASVTRHDGSSEPVKPGQIAVLVRDKWEAKATREALAKPEVGIRCVYLSQKESVFSDAEISEDIYHILVAINENNVKRSLKSALATPLMRGFGFDFRDLEKIETHESELELLIEEFGGYKKLWAEHGVLTALGKLMEKRGLYTAVAARQDSDRIITDFRHLGDILQQRDMETGTAEQLIDWYATQLDDDSALENDAKRIRLESDENLVKIVTIHVSKGLEYPIVFLPFFFLARPIKYEKQLPLYHDEQAGLSAVVDFESEPASVVQRMQKERMAEDVRMLYVAITRAIYQCNIGISGTSYNKEETVWKHLLGIDISTVGWDETKAALQRRIGNDELADYSIAGSVDPVKFRAPQEDHVAIKKPVAVRVIPSAWQITSYSALAHGTHTRFGDKADDELTTPEAVEEQPDEPALLEDDKKWHSNPRYTLKGSAITGNCLHDIFENFALAPGQDFRAVVEKQLGDYGLDKPRRDRNTSNYEYQKRSELYLAGIQTWLEKALKQPLRHTGLDDFPSLLDLFKSHQVSPEMEFDFAIGDADVIPTIASLNSSLISAGIDGLGSDFEKIHGMMTGAIDLVFVHEKKVYLLDYKSNTLGKSPRFYAQNPMSECMKDRRYDLQYMIYSTAVHRFFSKYFTAQYAFDPVEGGQLSFGGVYYLFLRGMGLEEREYGQHGIWFTRPDFEHIHTLDMAFRGGVQK